MSSPAKTTAKTEERPVLKLAQWRLMSENPLVDWLSEISLDWLEMSFSTETSASSWALMTEGSVAGYPFLARYSSTSCWLWILSIRF